MRKRTVLASLSSPYLSRRKLIIRRSSASRYILMRFLFIQTLYITYTYLSTGKDVLDESALYSHTRLTPWIEIQGRGSRAEALLCQGHLGLQCQRRVATGKHQLEPLIRDRMVLHFLCSSLRFQLDQLLQKRLLAGQGTGAA